MQDTGKKGKHAAKQPMPEPNEVEKESVSPAQSEEDDFVDEYDLYEDETEIPLRLKKKPSAKKASSKKRKAKKKKKRDVKVGDAVPPLFSDKKFKRKKSFFEIMTASTQEKLIKPATIFGHEVRYWPLLLLALLVLIVGFVVISNGSLSEVPQAITVVGLPEDLEDYKILVISDMNGKRFGDIQSSLTREIENIGYDMILCVGDMVGKDGDPEPFYEFLDGLSKPQRVYFICGDSDPGPFVDVARDIEASLEKIVLEDWILGAIERGATYVDAPIALDIGESRIWLTPTGYLNIEASSYLEDWKAQALQEEEGTVSGLTADYDSLPFTTYRYRLAQKFYSAVNSVSGSDVIIGLAHQPPNDSFIRSAAIHDSDNGKYFPEPELIVAGHNCGGVWRIPVIGAFYVPNRMLARYGWFPSQDDVRGLTQVGETQRFITGGLSTSSSAPLLPFRLFNNPEISVLQLTAKLPDNMLDHAD